MYADLDELFCLTQLKAMLLKQMVLHSHILFFKIQAIKSFKTLHTLYKIFKHLPSTGEHWKSPKIFFQETSY